MGREEGGLAGGCGVGATGMEVPPEDVVEHTDHRNDEVGSIVWAKLYATKKAAHNKAM